MNNVECIMKGTTNTRISRKSRQYWFIIHFALSILHYSFAQAQPPTRVQLVGTWIGVGVEYDEQFYRPNPVYIRLSADSTYSFGLIDANSPVRQSTWSVTSQSVRLDTSTYALSQWALSGNELRLSGAFPMTFRRLTEFVIDSAVVRQVLSGYTWATDTVSYHFHADGSACLKNPKTGDAAVHCWQLAQIGRSVFVVIKGNRDGCDGNFQYPLQITRLSADTMHCRGGGTGPDNRVLFRRGTRLMNKSHCEPEGFQPCRTYIFPRLICTLTFFIGGGGFSTFGR